MHAFSPLYLDKDPPPPWQQQQQQQRNLVIKISKIIGIKIEMPFPFWIMEIYFIMLTMMQIYWLLSLNILSCYKAVSVYFCLLVCLLFFALFCVETENCLTETQIQDSLPFHQSKAKMPSLFIPKLFPFLSLLSSSYIFGH